MTDRPSPDTGFQSEAEGYAASLRQMAKWIVDGHGQDVDEMELCAAADFIERCVPAQSPFLEPVTQADLDEWEIERHTKTGRVLIGWMERALKAEAALNAFTSTHSTKSPDWTEEYAESLFPQTKRRGPCDHKDCPRIGLPASLSSPDKPQPPPRCDCGYPRDVCRYPNCAAGDEIEPVSSPERTAESILADARVVVFNDVMTADETIDNLKILLSPVALHDRQGGEK